LETPPEGHKEPSPPSGDDPNNRWWGGGTDGTLRGEGLCRAGDTPPPPGE